MTIAIGIDANDRDASASGLSERLAERIRALGIKAPGSCTAFAASASIEAAAGDKDAAQMIRSLVSGREAVVGTARDAFAVAERATDAPTAVLPTQRMQAHEKNAWMLRSMLEQ